MSATGFSDGVLGGTAEEAIAAVVAEPLMTGGGDFRLSQLFDINDDLSGDNNYRCDALSMTLDIDGTATPQCRGRRRAASSLSPFGASSSLRARGTGSAKRIHEKPSYRSGLRTNPAFEEHMSRRGQALASRLVNAGRSNRVSSNPRILVAPVVFFETYPGLEYGETTTSGTQNLRRS